MKPRTIDPPRTKPAGGYVLCAAGGLFALWWLRKLGILRGLDFRVFFALLEMQARRCELPEGRDPRHGLLELSRLCGGTSEPELKRALRRLRKVGFVKGFTRATLVLARNADDLALDDETREFLDEKFLLLRSPKRLVPLPRRMVRLLASGACMTFAAVILGTAIATLFFKRGVVTARGAYKASWLAEAFGISERTVYRHRTYLVEELRWLRIIASPQLRQNANGLLVEVDLDWDGAPPISILVSIEPKAESKQEASQGTFPRGIKQQTRPRRRTRIRKWGLSTKNFGLRPELQFQPEFGTKRECKRELDRGEAQPQTCDARRPERPGATGRAACAGRRGKTHHGL
jgi:hypothetical protein